MAWRPILTVIVNPQPVQRVNPSRAGGRLRLVVNGAFLITPGRDKPR